MEKTIKQLKKELKEALEKVNDLKSLNDVRVSFLGKKGKITLLKEQLKELSVANKKTVGKMFNDFREEATNLIAEQEVSLQKEALDKQLLAEKIDITLPASQLKTGSFHPLELINDEIISLFVSMGYDVVRGPEIETDKYNFERLNIPKDHPARDMQDSFYITSKHILRTQTSPIQVRMMEKNYEKGPIRMIAPGKVYRKDDDDATHSHQFMQIEALVIDENISLAHLKGTLEVTMQKLFGGTRNIRFRPSYFPFTEPSLEVDVSCFKCDGVGCAFCKESGWLEVLGAGMVHPTVLQMSGYDNKKYSGFAFGIGIERIAMLKYGINDIREFYQNHWHFLDLFKRIDKEGY